MALMLSLIVWGFVREIPPEASEDKSSSKTVSENLNARKNNELEGRDDVRSSELRRQIAAAKSGVEVKQSDPRRLKQFASSDNLAAFVGQLKSSAAANDGEAMALIARAQDECAYLRIVKNRSEAFLKSLDGKSESEKQVAIAHNDTEQRRCLELSNLPGGKREDIARGFSDAAANGDSYGMMKQLETDNSSDIENKILRLREIVKSGNPEAIGIMAYSLGPSENSEFGVRGPYAGSTIDIVAWQLVACRLGRDCGESGSLMRALCLNQGVCLAITYEEFLRRFGATPREFLEAEKKEEEILHLINTESYDQIFPYFG